VKVEEGLGVRRPMHETQREDPPSNSVGLTDHDRDKHGHVRVQDLGHRGENAGNTPFGSTGMNSQSLECFGRHYAKEDLGNLKMLTSTIDVLSAAETGDTAQYRTMPRRDCNSRDAASHE
jgi:hypothetical protein